MCFHGFVGFVFFSFAGLITEQTIWKTAFSLPVSFLRCYELPFKSLCLLGCEHGRKAHFENWFFTVPTNAREDPLGQ